MLSQAGVQRSRRAHRPGGPGHAFVVERVHSLPAELGEARGVPRGGAFSRQGLVLSRLRVDLAELLKLPSQVVPLALSPRTKLFELPHRIRRRGPGGVSDGDCGAKLERPAVGVQQLGLRVAVEQRVVLMLAVEGDESVT